MFLLRQHNTVAVAPAPAPQSPQFEPGGARSRAADLAQRHAFFVDAEEQARPGGSTGRWCAEVDRREGGIESGRRVGNRSVPRGENLP